MEQLTTYLLPPAAAPQVEGGANGLAMLHAKVAQHGILTLYDGALGAWAANLAAKKACCQAACVGAM